MTRHQSGPISVIHHDDAIIVLDKPSGLLSVPGRGPDKQDSLATRVQMKFPGSSIVHRLDQPTSGVMIMARHIEAHRHIGRQFESRQISKRYHAVVDGLVQNETGQIDLPIRLDIDRRPYQIVDHVHGKPSVTRYRVLARQEKTTLLELTPITGRSHQLRVHLQALGHPILGDDLYAPPAVRTASQRLLLHAEMIRLTHPATLLSVTFESITPF